MKITDLIGEKDDDFQTCEDTQNMENSQDNEDLSV